MTNYRVVMIIERQGQGGNVKLFESTDFTTALNEAWGLVQKKGIPASQVDILQQNAAGLWESVWSEIEQRGQSCAK